MLSGSVWSSRAHIQNKVALTGERLATTARVPREWFSILDGRELAPVTRIATSAVVRVSPPSSSEPCLR